MSVGLTPTDAASLVAYSGERVSLMIDAALPVARIVATRADSGNAIDDRYVVDFTASVQRLVPMVAAAEVRAVLIEADGASFSVGGDLKYFNQRLDRLSEELVSMIGPFHDSLLALAELPVPVVAAVQGAVAGGALGLLWCADIVIAGSDLKLVTAFSRLGVSGDGGSSWYLPRLAGQTRALELLLESPVLNADEAQSYGLVTRVVPVAELRSHADESVARLAAGPTKSLGLQRSLVRHALDRTLSEGLAAELDAMRSSGASRDAAEGMGAFAARRVPTFENH